MSYSIAASNFDIGSRLLDSSAPSALMMRSALSNGTQLVEKNARQLWNGLTPSQLFDGHRTLSMEEKLFDARAAAKQLIATVSMHIDPQKRKRLFAQIDSIHDPEEFPADDTPLIVDSLAAFLRALFELSPAKYPSLGLTADGNLLAVWGREGDRLTIEFLRGRRARWSLTHRIGEQVERAVGEGAISRLRVVLSPYEPEHWFSE